MNTTNNTLIEPNKILDRSAFARLGFDAEEALEMTRKLNTLLASYMVFYHKLRNFHWNIVGPDFFELHEKFEDVYNQAKINIDDIAERVRTLGLKPYSTMNSCITASMVKETNEVPRSTEMAKRIVVDVEILIECVVDVHGTAAEAGDIGTVSLLMRLTEQLEKAHWMFNSWSK